MKMQPAPVPGFAHLRPLKATEILPPASIFASSPPANSDEDIHKDTRDLILRGLQLSFVIYDPLDHLAVELKRAGYTHIEPINVRWTGTQALCCVRGETAYIVFRGSASLLDWLLDFCFIPFYWPLSHFGFGTAWRSVRSKVRNWQKTLPPLVTHTILSGHSLGGGIATLAALELAGDTKLAGVVTFGAPKACFLWTAKRYQATKISGSDKTLGEITHTVVNQRDIVSRVPFALMGYRPVGELTYINRSNEVLYGETAISTRENDSGSDLDYLLYFLEEDKIGQLSLDADPIQKVLHMLRIVMASVAKNVPLLKGPLILPALYILFCTHFMRSGLAHMGANYTQAFYDGIPVPLYRPYQQKRWRVYLSLAFRLTMGIAMTILFVWGLYEVTALSVAGLQKNAPAP